MLKSIFPEFERLFWWKPKATVPPRPVMLVWNAAAGCYLPILAPPPMITARFRGEARRYLAIHDRVKAKLDNLQAGDVLVYGDEPATLENACWSLGVVLAVLAAVLLATRVGGGADRKGAVTCETVGHPTAVVDGVFREAHRQGAICFELDGKTRNAAWVMAIITPEMLRARAERVDNFHADERVPEAWRSTPSQFKGVGKDRGHLLAQRFFAGDPALRDASCSMVNITPQDANLNQHFWRDEIEEKSICQPIRERGLTAAVCVFPLVAKPKNGKLVVETIGPNDVWVPDRYALAVLFFEKGKPLEAQAWIVPNQPIEGKTEADYRVPVRQVEAESGFDVYWALDDKVETALEAK